MRLVPFCICFDLGFIGREFMPEKTEEIKAAPRPTTSKSAPTRAAGDLSVEIERAMEKEPLDRIRCIHVFGDYYRCNWWAPPVLKGDRNKAFDWAVATTHHVRKSSFLSATMNAGQLKIEVVQQKAPVEVD
jgi:hypothetical protein